MTSSSSHTYSEALIPIGDAARRLSVSVATLRRWERDGRIHAVRTPTGHRRFRLAEVESLLQAGA
ncbi:MerR family transcriptional regulator [Gordonia jacobaea]|nr:MULTISPECIES: helix-turn-helix domain-containing protein [Gordonia]